MLTLKSEGKRCWVASVIKGQECCKINSVLVSTMSMPLPSLFQPSITTEPLLPLTRFVYLIYCVALDLEPVMACWAYFLTFLISASYVPNLIVRFPN